MDVILLFFAFLAGSSLVVQAAVNRSLAEYAGGAPVWATMTSAFVTISCLFLYQVAVRSKWPAAAQFSMAPWWVWTGGLLGTVVMLTPVLLVGRLGAALLFAAIITGQLVCSLLVDHLGALGLPRHPITLTRLCGTVLLFIGVYLVRR
jgi:bacterial/archaeal transporter family-2 protein